MSHCCELRRPPSPTAARDVGAEDEGQPVELDREQQDEEQVGEEVGREADEGQGAGDPVEQRVWPGGGIDAHRQGDHQRQHREAPITASVTGTCCRIRVSTLTRLMNEKPQSPWSIAASQRK